jgi:hypothetical protein
MTKSDMPGLNESKFWSRVNRGAEHECWNWTGSYAGKKMRYGKLMVRGVVVRAHRVALMLSSGSVSDSMDVMHRCDNPLCCNPNHLSEGTRKENMTDCVLKGRSARGEKSGQSKLKNRTVPKLILLASQRTQTEAARKFGVSQSLVSLIVNNKRRAR